MSIVWICITYKLIKSWENEKMKITRAKILRTIRVAVCIIIAAFILFTVGIVNNVFKYVFVRWNLDILQNNLESGIPLIYQVIVLIWNYIVGFVMIGLIWRYLAIPKVTVIGKVYKRFRDTYYLD
jgi:uncharacterized BrkB/YihY/UPF0761 family membrane protein